MSKRTPKNSKNDPSWSPFTTQGGWPTKAAAQGARKAPGQRRK